MSPRRTAALAVVALALAVAMVLVGAWLAWTVSSPDVGSEVVVRVPRGASLHAVADSLVAHDLLTHRRTFLWGARLTGNDRSIQAGRYALSRGLSPRDLLARLVAGRTLPLRITLPEGIESSSTASLVAEAFPWSAVEFLAVADSLTRIMIVATPGFMGGASLATYESVLRSERERTGRPFPLCEGYLFPDTYHFAEGTGCVDVVRAVIDQGATHWRNLAVGRVDEGASTLSGMHEALTLASIVEAETPREEEMPLVAAVYLNRLARGISLEADPTVAHAVDKRGERILYVDLEVESPYNTYRRRGLPPGPIGNPGLAAVRAVLTPATGFDALFFVADGEGGHVFSRTLAEHQEAVRVYRRKRAMRGGR